MTKGAKPGICPKCGKHELLLPLHGERGGPLMCIRCGTDWNVEHGRRRKMGRLVIKAMKAYMAAGGHYGDLDKLKLAAGGVFKVDILAYDGDTIGADVGDISLELLTETLGLTHPDLHPPERKERAHRVTAALTALKPFVFPEPKPEKPSPTRDPSPIKTRPDNGKPSRPAYPCELCAETTPTFYCDPCKAKHEKEQQQKRDQREQERQRRNARQRERYAARRYWAKRRQIACAQCGEDFTPKRADQKYCCRACKQKAYVAREGRGTNERPIDHKHVEQVIDAIFTAESDNAFTVDDLCERVFPSCRTAKKHRTAIIGAGKKTVMRRPLWDWWRNEGRGNPLVFFNCENLMSYGLGRMKGDWLWGRYTEEKLRADLNPGGRDHEKIAEGGPWHRHWQMRLAELKEETDTPQYKALREKQREAERSWGLA